MIPPASAVHFLGIQQSFKNHKELSLFKTDMGCQAFSEVMQLGDIGLLELNTEATQFPVIAFHLRHKCVFTGGNQQRQQGGFFDYKVGIKLGMKRSKAGRCGCFDERQIT